MQAGVSGCLAVKWSRRKRGNEGLLCINGRGRSIKWKNLEDIGEIAPDSLAVHAPEPNSLEET